MILPHIYSSFNFVSFFAVVMQGVSACSPSRGKSREPTDQDHQTGQDPVDAVEGVPRRGLQEVLPRGRPKPCRSRGVHEANLSSTSQGHEG